MEGGTGASDSGHRDRADFGTLLIQFFSGTVILETPFKLRAVLLSWKWEISSERIIVESGEFLVTYFFIGHV